MALAAGSNMICLPAGPGRCAIYLQAAHGAGTHTQCSVAKQTVNRPRASQQLQLSTAGSRSFLHVSLMSCNFSSVPDYGMEVILLRRGSCVLSVSSGIRISGCFLGTSEMVFFLKETSKKVHKKMLPLLTFPFH
jgi:hypothetical protein